MREIRCRVINWSAQVKDSSARRLTVNFDYISPPGCGSLVASHSENEYLLSAHHRATSFFAN